MAYKVAYTQKAFDDLSRLQKSTARRIVNKIAFFVQQTNLISFAKRLTDKKYGQYRFRVGDYRIIFDIDDKNVVRVLVILRVVHRREAYL